MTKTEQKLDFTDSFADRHIGPRLEDVQVMLKDLGFSSFDEFIKATVPARIRLDRPLDLARGRTEAQSLGDLKKIALQNDIWRSFIGMGYSNTFTPGVIQRNILENPGWYTQYTPYQAEIAQGRLEA